MPHPGTSWSGKVTCFKTNPINCTLLGRWEPSYKDPWLILTYLEPEQADILWYGSGIECSYRDVKSDGWQWQKTRLTAPARAERIWRFYGSSYFMDFKCWGKCRFSTPGIRGGYSRRRDILIISS